MAHTHFFDASNFGIALECIKFRARYKSGKISIERVLALFNRQRLCNLLLYCMSRNVPSFGFHCRVQPNKYMDFFLKRSMLIDTRINFSGEMLIVVSRMYV